MNNSNFYQLYKNVSNLLLIKQFSVLCHFLMIKIIYQDGKI